MAEFNVTFDKNYPPEGVLAFAAYTRESDGVSMPGGSQEPISGTYSSMNVYLSTIWDFANMSVTPSIIKAQRRVDGGEWIDFNPGITGTGQNFTWQLDNGVNELRVELHDNYGLVGYTNILQYTKSEIVFNQQFDYLVVRYKWTPTSGRDLDTFTGFINTGTGYDNDWVGYKQGEIQVPGISQQPTPELAYLRWATDNTSESGVEAILINFKKYTEDFPALAEIIKVQLAAIWWGEKKSGNIEVELTTYLGGTMVFDQPTFNFINNGGNIAETMTIAKNVTAAGNSANVNDANILNNVVYNKTTKKAYLE